jgi:hypothetical protein
MADMLVNLAALPDLAPIIAGQKTNGVHIRRGQPEESHKIAEWIREQINPNWAIGCEVALEQEPVTCFIAIETKKSQDDNQSDLLPASILGFACYDVVTKGVFGPTGVRQDQADSGIDTALLLVCLHEMAALDYKQAVIGWTAFMDGSNKMDFGDN